MIKDLDIKKEFAAIKANEKNLFISPKEAEEQRIELVRRERNKHPCMRGGIKCLESLSVS